MNSSEHLLSAAENWVHAQCCVTSHVSHGLCALHPCPCEPDGAKGLAATRVRQLGTQLATGGPSYTEPGEPASRRSLAEQAATNTYTCGDSASPLRALRVGTAITRTEAGLMGPCPEHTRASPSPTLGTYRQLPDTCSR